MGRALKAAVVAGSVLVLASEKGAIAADLKLDIRPRPAHSRNIGPISHLKRCHPAIKPAPHIQQPATVIVNTPKNTDEKAGRAEIVTEPPNHNAPVTVQEPGPDTGKVEVKPEKVKEIPPPNVVEQTQPKGPEKILKPSDYLWLIAIAIAAGLWLKEQISRLPEYMRRNRNQ